MRRGECVLDAGCAAIQHTFLLIQREGLAVLGKSECTHCDRRPE